MAEAEVKQGLLSDPGFLFILTLRKIHFNPGVMYSNLSSIDNSWSLLPNGSLQFLSQSWKEIEKQ